MLRTTVTLGLILSVAAQTVIPVPVPTAIATAFAADGWNATRAVSYNGQIGVAAQSLTQRVNQSGAFKPAYFVSGSGYEMGYMHGYLAEPAVSVMTSTYLEHIIPSLISEELDQLLQNSSLAPIYDVLITLLEDLVVTDSSSYFMASVEAGAIDTRLVDEMRGLVDGARAANVFTPATFDKVAALNFGYDMLLALIYTGEILNLLGSKAAAAGWTAPQLASLAALPHTAWRPPVLCNAFTATGAAVAGGSGALMGRDFMFSMGEVFQDYVSSTMYAPSDADRKPMVSVAAPGFIGSMVAMNSDGFMMGVDVLQAALGNTTVIGLNSLLMVRTVAHAASTTAQATALVRAAQRGVPWIYPMQDATGDGRILETLPSGAAGAGQGGSDAIPDFRYLVQDPAIRALLPSPQQLQAMLPAGLDFSGGVYVRNTSLHLSPETTLIPSVNPGLYAAANMSMPNASAWGPGGYVFPTFTAEDSQYAQLKQNWFSPERAVRSDVVITTNLAVVPPVRIAAMSFWTGLDGMSAPQWRYDGLMDTLLAAIAAGPGLDMESAKEVITFLGRVPGYYGPVVEGVMAVGDCVAKVIAVKGGYWVDGFTQLTLPAYVS